MLERVKRSKKKNKDSRLPVRKLNSGTPMEFELESGLLLEPENGICCPENVKGNQKFHSSHLGYKLL
jgi:hypothetical protein